MEKKNTINPAYLCLFRQQISEIIKGMKDAGIYETPLSESVNNAIKQVDSVVVKDIQKTLVSKFGNCNWDVKIDAYLVPVLNKGTRRNDYRYAIKNITWANGPTIHEVYYFIAEKFTFYLHSKTYDSSMFKRLVPNIEKRYTSHFVPLPIKGKEFRAIDVFLSKIIHRISENEVKQYYALKVNDPKLGISNIRAKTPEEVFLIFQERLEAIFYLKDNTKETRTSHDQLMKYVVSASAEKPGGPPPELTKEEGGDLGGTDETEVRDVSSIPEEEPIFDTSGREPTQEEIDHNFHDDQKPEIEALFKKENPEEGGEEEEEGGEAAAAAAEKEAKEEEAKTKEEIESEEAEAAEEAAETPEQKQIEKELGFHEPETPEEEALEERLFETPEQETAEESKAMEGGEESESYEGYEASLGFTIDELMAKSP